MVTLSDVIEVDTQSSGSSATSSFTTPNGNFSRWHSGEISNNTYLTVLDSTYCDMPTRLTEAYE